MGAPYPLRYGPLPSHALVRTRGPRVPALLGLFRTIVFAVPIQWRVSFVALCRLQEGSIWVAEQWCSCNSMCSCVLGCVLACCFVLSCFEGSGRLRSATCVGWYVPHGNTGLPEHGDPMFPYFCPLNQNLPCVRTGGRGNIVAQIPSEMAQDRKDVNLGWHGREKRTRLTFASLGWP